MYIASLAEKSVFTNELKEHLKSMKKSIDAGRYMYGVGSSLIIRFNSRTNIV